MRYGILGDIHANRTALDAVLALLDEAGVDRLVSVGDVVGYGPSPSDCIRILRERDAAVVLGNHDAACAGRLDERYFNNYARIAVRWTRRALSAEETTWLAELPFTVNLEDCEVAHGSLFRPESFSYTQTPLDADPSLDRMRTPVCFVGHTHVPVVLWRLRSRPDRTEYSFETDLDLRRAERSLVNVGSVGQPRDEDPRAAYALYDSEGQSVAIRRVSYDIQREVELSRGAGLPKVLAERLFLGV